MKEVFQIELNKQFRKAFDLVEKTNKNVFITGKAGTGKSTFLDYFRYKTKKPIVVLAPTGVAAVNVQGETIHSFFKFRPDITPKQSEEIARKASKKRKDVFKSLEAIVIDEISMVRADLLDCIDIFLKIILKNRLPFGGKQMIFIGDLYQLSPVTTSKEKEVFRTEYRSPYFFDAKAMNNFEMEFIELEKIYRQKDKKFIEILNSIRNNTVNDKHLEILNMRVKEDVNLENLEEGCIYLTTTNRLVDKINKSNLEKLPSKKYIFHGEIEGKFDNKLLPTDITLEVKKGAQIMLLNNDPRGRWINGTIGKIIGIRDNKIKVKLQDGKCVSVPPFKWEIFETYFNKNTSFLDKRVLGSFIQYPVRLAWAITVHKSQGKTFDKVIVDLSGGVFACGQVYVALSRCRILGNLILKKKIKKNNVFTDWRIVKFITDYQYRLSEKSYSKEEKIEIIKQAIANKTKLKIVYLKAKDEKSERIILPLKLGEMEYCGKRYLGLKTYCFLRNKERVFNVGKILEIALAN